MPRPPKKIGVYEFRTKTQSHSLDIRCDTKDGTFSIDFGGETFRNQNLETLKLEIAKLAESRDNAEFKPYIAYYIWEPTYSSDSENRLELNCRLLALTEKIDEGERFMRDAWLDRFSSEMEITGVARRYTYRWRDEKLIPYTPERWATLLGIQEMMQKLKTKLKETLGVKDDEQLAANFDRIAGFARLAPGARQLPAHKDDDEEDTAGKADEATAEIVSFALSGGSEEKKVPRHRR